MQTSADTLVVAAGVVIEGTRVLLSQRKKGAHLAESWEFPGGKVEPNEDPRDCVARELMEEVGIEVTVGEILDVTFYRYPQKSMLLLFYAAKRTTNSNDPVAIDVAAVRWAEVDDLREEFFPPADINILRRVRHLLQLAAEGQQ